MLADAEVLPALELRKSVPFMPMALNPLLIESDETGIHIRSDVDVLIRQQEYLNRHPELATKFLESAASDRGLDAKLEELKSRVSDDDLLNYCKDRRIQTPTEMRAWAEFLMSEMTDLRNETDARYTEDLNAYLLEQQQKIENQKTSVEPNPE